MLSCAASLLMTLAAAVLPKSTETPLEDYLNKMVPQTGGYNINAGLSQNFAIRSSVNTGNNQQPDKILFSVVTEKPQLLKRWVFAGRTTRIYAMPSACLRIWFTIRIW